MPSTRPSPPARRYGGVGAEERIAARRERLLDAGLERYGTHGWQATGVKDVCREAGLTDRYFYESFADPLALFIAVFDTATDALLGDVAAAVTAVTPRPEEQIAVAIGTFVRALADDPRVARIVFSEAAAAGAEAEAHMRRTLRRFAALIVATARPHVAPTVPDRVLRMGALALVGAIERVMVDWQEGELDATLEQVTDYLVELFLATGPTVGLPTAP